MLNPALYLFFFQSATTPAAAVQTYSGGWFIPQYRYQTDDEKREERERLGIIPREQKKLERAARAIAKRIEPGVSLEQLQQEVMRAEEFNRLMADISQRNRDIIDGLALMMAQAIEARILEELRDEDDAIAMLLLEM